MKKTKFVNVKINKSQRYLNNAISSILSNCLIDAGYQCSKQRFNDLLDKYTKAISQEFCKLKIVITVGNFKEKRK